MRHSLFYPSVSGFIIGIFIRSFLIINRDILVFVFLASLCFIAYLFSTHTIYSKKELKIYSWNIVIAVFVVVGIGAVFRYDIFSQDRGDKYLQLFIDKKIEVSGVVVDEPAEKDHTTRLTVELHSMFSNDVERKETALTSTKVIADDGAYSHVEYGDEISIKGTLALPQNFVGDNGREFDYISYLAKDKIFYVVTFPQIIIQAHHKASWIREHLFLLKHTFIQKLDDAIPFPASRLAAGLTIAGKKALPKNIQDEFTTTGTVQVVVLSGYNVTVIADSLMSLTSSLSFILRSTFGVIGIVLFTITAGGTATVVRGSVMALIALLANILRRRYSVLRALIIAGIGMLFMNPMLLVYDPSFQLSFLATLGLILVSPILEKHFIWVTERYELRKVFASTVATQLFVLPFILYLTGQLSLVAVPANMLLFLFIPTTMLICFIVGVLGFLNMLFSHIVGYLAYVFLGYELAVVHVFSKIPYASLTVTYFPPWLLLMSYLCYAVLILKYHNKKT